MKRKKVLIGIIVLCVLLLGGKFGWDKYIEVQNEKCIQAVQNMQHANYGSVTFDQAVRNYFENSPVYGSADGKVLVSIRDKNSESVAIMEFTVDLKNDIEYLNSCMTPYGIMTAQEANDLISTIYSYSS